MIPKIIHQTSKEFTWEERKLTSRSKKIMPDFEFKLWSDEENLNLVNKHFPQYLQAYQNAWHGVIRADIARCLYLHEFGGIYCDTDYKFFKPIDNDFLAENCILGIEEEFDKGLNTTKYGNAFMASEKGFHLWLPFVKSAFERLQNGEKNILFIAGPHALSIYLKNNNQYNQQIKPYQQSSIYPDFKYLKTSFHKTDKTIGGHLCWGGWRNKPFFSQLKCRARRLISSIV
ncbi:glycosyltransferase family 32 protein [Aquitalea sp. LB_tupeE]|uniref:glycosyltransferase family 32 protein n=1 Tax=Aquitalea sp. LB_tupeE TaxID=2748078 RepID=UPI0015BF5232|nr:glycosyltransferase [Aquitalea sp. LB_tupeE]NWK79446.1 hypothetical protein [Aquitalea sp. LB_tupeE]